VVSRNKDENEKIAALQLSKYERFKLPLPGPLSIVSKNATPADRELAAKIALTYSKAKPEERYEVKIGDEAYEVSPFADKSEAQRYMIR